MGGELVELLDAALDVVAAAVSPNTHPLVDEHSARRNQVAASREALEMEWRIAHPGQEPGPRQ
ncbi:MAG: hypothetical protein B5766_02820 [Candidatus Lumbricidophila eiseniae]|uniref:Uncharacterized protein n=1 Tax=Candidatus Lumbricidiphila eiseniae TaxID=1969409 RepID=A0A2A6FT67_9MICO|nr:MAG: hypothetical protein B5766_02820 [Candidatus Lumbricidophila eiseniae]